MELKVCVIGCGQLGQMHARTWQQVPEARVVAVADPWRERAQALGEELGCQWFADYREALQMKGLNAVSIAVPSAYHYECTMAALARGCHVICEKPIALDITEAREMIREAEKRRLKLAIGFCKRFMQQVQLTHELIQQGRLGRPVMYRHISAWEIRPKPWIMDKHLGGGPIFDISCHYTDQWRVIFGSNPVRVKASGLTIMAQSPDKPDIDPQYDTFAMTVEYESGDIGVLSMSWGLPKGVIGQTLEDCLGPLGLLHIEPRKIELWGPAGLHEIYSALNTDMHPAQLNAFAAAIREDKPVAASGEDGLWALQVSLAALRSIETGEAIFVASPWED